MGNEYLLLTILLFPCDINSFYILVITQPTVFINNFLLIISFKNSLAKNLNVKVQEMHARMIQCN